MENQSNSNHLEDRKDTPNRYLAWATWEGHANSTESHSLIGTWEDIMDMLDDKAPDFEDGSDYHYFEPSLFPEQLYRVHFSTGVLLSLVGYRWTFLAVVDPDPSVGENID